jgi:hypothetical protein
MNAFGCHTECLNQPAGVGRRRHDGIGTPRVRWREFGVVAADFRLRAVGCVHEEQVVDGDHLGGPSRRNEQRVRAVHHVVVARQPFHRRPFPPVPQVVEHPDRDVSIDDAGPQLPFELRRWTVLP